MFFEHGSPLPVFQMFSAQNFVTQMFLNTHLLSHKLGTSSPRRVGPHPL